MGMYQCRFRHNGVIRYGIVSLGEKNVPAGHVAIEDAVYPRSFHIPEADCEDVPFSFGRLNSDGWFWGSDAVHDYMTLAHLVHQIHEPAGNALIPGRLFSVGVADGSAHYVVTVVKRVNCDIEWRGFQGDRYFDRMFGWGGTFRKRDVECYLRGGMFNWGVKESRPIKTIFQELATDFISRFGEPPKEISDCLEYRCK